jgi:divalent metal cation (Fe/Co/Zn/Cd) transporter
MIGNPNHEPLGFLDLPKMYSDVMDSRLHKRALSLSYFTVGYNISEGIVSILAGLLAGSIALVGFGLDSFVESLVERKAVRFVSYTFFILGAYVLYESIEKLHAHEIPDPSLLGIIIAIVSIIVMPILFYLKYQTGKSIGSRSLVADSKETLACVFLSGALLVGLGLNYLYGFWQADPIVGLVIVTYLVKEGYSTLKEGEL